MGDPRIHRLCLAHGLEVFAVLVEPVACVGGALADESEVADRTVVG